MQWKWSVDRTILHIPAARGYADNCILGNIPWLPDHLDGYPDREVLLQLKHPQSILFKSAIKNFFQE